MKNKFRPRKYKVIRLNEKRYDIISKGKFMFIAEKNNNEARVCDWLIIDPVRGKLVLRPTCEGGIKKMEFKVLWNQFYEKDLRFRKTKAHEKLGMKIRRMEKEMKEDERRERLQKST